MTSVSALNTPAPRATPVATSTGPSANRTMIEFSPPPPLAASAPPAPTPSPGLGPNYDVPTPLARPIVTPVVSTAVPPSAIPAQTPRVAPPPPDSNPTLVDNVIDRMRADAVPPERGSTPPSASPNPVSPPGPSGSAIKRTMIGLTAGDLFATAPTQPVQPAQTQPEPQPQSAPQQRGGVAKTMMGMVAPDLSQGSPKQQQPLASPPQQQPQDPGGEQRHRTMLGVAMPGIAPTNTGPAQAPHPQQPQQPQHYDYPAPYQQPPQRAPHVSIVPAPPPLAEHEQAPAAPIRGQKKGIPIALVAVLVGLIVIAGAGIIVFFLRGGPIAASARLDAQGKEVLHLRCDSCKDGTRADLDGKSAVFAAGEADLPLAQPLKVGDNALQVKIDRPGFSRDENLKLTVPLTFRIHADVSTLDGASPAISVKVEAIPGTDVQIEGKPLALDGSGKGVFAVDVSPETEGPSDESRPLQKTMAYVVTPRGGAPEKGTVSARVSIVPLRVDAPLAHTVIDSASFIVAGRAAKGSVITVNGNAATISPEGTFEATVDAPAGASEVKAEVRASAPQMAPRFVHVVVKKVAKLDAESKARDAANPLGYDAFASDIAGKTGQMVVVDGSVLESRVAYGRTVIVVDAKRGCAKGPCVARVILGQKETLAAGDGVRFYGRVTKGVQFNGKSVPEVEADFMVKVPRLY